MRLGRPDAGDRDVERALAQASALGFVQALRHDLDERRDKWENRTVGDYVGAVARSVRDYLDDEYEVLERWSATAGWLWMGRLYE